MAMGTGSSNPYQALKEALDLAEEKNININHVHVKDVKGNTHRFQDLELDCIRGPKSDSPSKSDSFNDGQSHSLWGHCEYYGLTIMSDSNSGALYRVTGNKSHRFPTSVFQLSKDGKTIRKIRTLATTDEVRTFQSFRDVLLYDVCKPENERYLTIDQYGHSQLITKNPHSIKTLKDSRKNIKEAAEIIPEVYKMNGDYVVTDKNGKEILTPVVDAALRKAASKWLPPTGDGSEGRLYQVTDKSHTGILKNAVGCTSELADRLIPNPNRGAKASYIVVGGPPKNPCKCSNPPDYIQPPTSTNGDAIYPISIFADRVKCRLCNQTKKVKDDWKANNDKRTPESRAKEEEKGVPRDRDVRRSEAWQDRGGNPNPQFFGIPRHLSLGPCGLCGLIQGKDPSGQGEHSLYLCQAAHLNGDARRTGHKGHIKQHTSGRDHSPGQQSTKGWEELDRKVVAACPECHTWYDRHFGGKDYDSMKKELYAGYREGMR